MFSPGFTTGFSFFFFNFPIRKYGNATLGVTHITGVYFLPLDLSCCACLNALDVVLDEWTRNFFAFVFHTQCHSHQQFDHYNHVSNVGNILLQLFFFFFFFLLLTNVRVGHRTANLVREQIGLARYMKKLREKYPRLLNEKNFTD